MKLLSSILIGVLCSFSCSVWADDCADTVYVTVADLQDRMVESDTGAGEFFVEIDDLWFPINMLYADENGYCYLEAGIRGSEGPIFKCPCVGCGRLQSLKLLRKNNYHC